MDKGDVFSILTALIIVSVLALLLRPPVAEAGPEIPPEISAPTPAVTVPPRTDACRAARTHQALLRDRSLGLPPPLPSP
ncbi:hypothetical protein [Methanoculleus chikugoensis]|uniref:hypothetical protein n=1 Tax=Methanoculleus chikugoensis TaxID=118126 RepID=UPI0006D23980|nr:hypothetical protein [Methanoculleus chikugoensis]